MRCHSVYLEKVVKRLAIVMLASMLTFPVHAKDHSGRHNSNYCSSCPRDSHGHIKRSPEAKSEFKKSHPCPTTGKSSGPCSGYVIDHVEPLKRGGADAPYNMQWQTKEAAKQKDNFE